MALTPYLIGSLSAGAALGVGLVVIGTLRRRRIREEVRSVEPRIDEGDIARILAEGQLRKDDEPPLDLGEIEKEEERFWSSESWDSADEW